MDQNFTKCLDHGFVRLIDSMGSDIDVVRAARVSYDAAWRAGEDEGSDQKLLKYLWRNKHSTPFEMVQLKFEIKAPIFVIRQWHRHRTWSYNEVSARYTELPEEFYLPDPATIGKQSKSSKQARVFGGDVELSTGEFLQRQFEVDCLNRTCEASFDQYKYLLQQGWPKELARSVLPVNTYTHMIASVDLLNFLKFCTLRTHQHAQYEIRVYAEAMVEMVKEIVPVTMAAWEESMKPKQ